MIPVRCKSKHWQIKTPPMLTLEILEIIYLARNNSRGSLYLYSINRINKYLQYGL